MSLVDITYSPKVSKGNTVKGDTLSGYKNYNSFIVHTKIKSTLQTGCQPTMYRYNSSIIPTMSPTAHNNNPAGTLPTVYDYKGFKEVSTIFQKDIIVYISKAKYVPNLH